jgi:hypothetical protein
VAGLAEFKSWLWRVGCVDGGGFSRIARVLTFPARAVVGPIWPGFGNVDRELLQVVAA